MKMADGHYKLTAHPPKNHSAVVEVKDDGMTIDAPWGVFEYKDPPGFYDCEPINTGIDFNTADSFTAMRYPGEPHEEAYTGTVERVSGP